MGNKQEQKNNKRCRPNQKQLETHHTSHQINKSKNKNWKWEKGVKQQAMQHQTEAN